MLYAVADRKVYFDAVILSVLRMILHYSKYKRKKV